MDKPHARIHFVMTTLVLCICLSILGIACAAANETSYSTPFPWNGHTMQVSYALDDGTVKSGHAAAILCG